MIIPTFIDKSLLSKVELSKTDLENEIIGLGLSIKSYGVIDKDTDKLQLIVEGDREYILSKVREYLIDKPINEKVEIFWSNLNKYSIVCDVNFVIQNLSGIFDEDWDFWIISENRKWIIENYHEEQLSIFVFLRK